MKPKTKAVVIQICLLVAMLLPAPISYAQTVTQVAAAGYYTMFIKSDGSLWAMGQNNYGQLGDGTTNNAYYPEEIVTSGVTAIAAGGDHSLFIRHRGLNTELWAMGANNFGQLGDGTTVERNAPVKILSQSYLQVGSAVTAVAAGNGHSLFIKSDGSLWAMGNNTNGELGDGTYVSTNRPEEILSSGATSIAAGSFNSMFTTVALNNTNVSTLWVMGNNAYGQLGNGSYSNACIPDPIASGINVTMAVELNTCVYSASGKLFGMGDNLTGELGDFNVGNRYNKTNQPYVIATNDVLNVAGGDFHTLFVANDADRIWDMGWDGNGCLGDGGQYDSYRATIDPVTTYAPPNANFPNDPVTALAAGASHSVFIQAGSLWGMGANNSGQLGLGQTNESTFPSLLVPGLFPGYNQITVQPSAGGNIQLTFVGILGVGYDLDRTFNLTPPVEWDPQVLNTAGDAYLRVAGEGGLILLTNLPVVANTNNFWRVRSLPYEPGEGEALRYW